MNRQTLAQLEHTVIKQCINHLAEVHEAYVGILLNLKRAGYPENSDMYRKFSKIESLIGQAWSEAQSP